MEIYFYLRGGILFFWKKFNFTWRIFIFFEISFLRGELFLIASGITSVYRRRVQILSYRIAPNDESKSDIIIDTDGNVYKDGEEPEIILGSTGEQVYVPTETIPITPKSTKLPVATTPATIKTATKTSTKITN